MSLAGARVLARWCPARRRREPGLRLLHGTWEGERRYRSTVHLGLCSHPVDEREPAEADTEGSEYRCGVRWRTGL